jgi:hypothetical protein
MDFGSLSESATLAPNGQSVTSPAADPGRANGAPEGGSRAQARIQDLAREKNDYRDQRDQALRTLEQIRSEYVPRSELDALRQEIQAIRGGSTQAPQGQRDEDFDFPDITRLKMGDLHQLFLTSDVNDPGSRAAMARAMEEMIERKAEQKAKEHVSKARAEYDQAQQKQQALYDSWQQCVVEFGPEVQNPTSPIRKLAGEFMDQFVRKYGPQAKQSGELVRECFFRADKLILERERDTLRQERDKSLNELKKRAAQETQITRTINRTSEAREHLKNGNVSEAFRAIGRSQFNPPSRPQTEE